MGNIFAIFGIGAGVYCLYAYVMMIKKKEITQAIFLPKDLRLKKCKDVDGYIKDTSLPLLVLGVALTLYGISEVVNAYYMPIDTVIIAGVILVLLALVWFGVVVRKANQKYFG